MRYFSVQRSLGRLRNKLPRLGCVTRASTAYLRIQILTILIQSLAPSWPGMLRRVRMTLRSSPRESAVRERRRSNRFKLRGRVCLDLGGQRFEFPSADLSITGVGILLDVAVLGAKPSGEVGVCTIESPDLSASVEAYVSVMRIRRIGQQHLVGLRFESISDEQLAIIRAFEARCREKSVAEEQQPF